MPHFGLMDAAALGPKRAALQRARLHIRSGKRRLRQGKINTGAVTLYDAFIHAMEYYLLAQPDKDFPYNVGDVFRKEKEVYRYLLRKGAIDGTFDYEEFKTFVDEAVEENLFRLPGWTLESLELVMTQLGVMPFDEASLPPESADTY